MVFICNSDVSLEVDQRLQHQRDLEKELERLSDPRDITALQQQQQGVLQEIEQKKSRIDALHQEMRQIDAEIRVLEEKSQEKEPVSVEV
jgi:peptidoglycan hydrolase CwlO-like protein